MITRQKFVPALSGPLLAQARKPNIVLTVSDDHHWQCLGAAGNPNIRTPNLDKLTRPGVLFTNAIISPSQCAPSRGILLSGLESYQSGLDCNDHTGFRSFNGATVVEQLRRGGYETTLVGKWHIRPSPKECSFTKAPCWLAPAAIAYQTPAHKYIVWESKKEALFDLKADPFEQSFSTATAHEPQVPGRTTPRRFAAASLRHRVMDKIETATSPALRLDHKLAQSVGVYFSLKHAGGDPAIQSG